MTIIVTWSTEGVSPFLEQTSPGFWPVVEPWKKSFWRFLGLRRDDSHMGKTYDAKETSLAMRAITEIELYV